MVTDLKAENCDEILTRISISLNEIIGTCGKWKVTRRRELFNHYKKLGFRFKTPASNLLRFWVDIMSEQVDEELEWKERRKERRKEKRKKKRKKTKKKRRKKSRQQQHQHHQPSWGHPSFFYLSHQNCGNRHLH